MTKFLLFLYDFFSIRKLLLYCLTTVSILSLFFTSDGNLIHLNYVDGNRLLVSSSFSVFIILLIVYGRIELALITITPVALVAICISGLMSVFGIGFNHVNIIIFVVIFCLSVNYSIFITAGLRNEYRTGRKTLPMHKLAIIQPFLFRWFISGRTTKGKPPYTFMDIFRRKHLKESRQTTDIHYFRRLLIANFIYKSPVLEWYLRIKLNMEDNYRMFDRLVPQQAVITDLGCGYGFLTYMLAFLSEKRIITGVDYDDDKIEIANHCFSKNDRIQFIAANAVEYPLQPSDVFILSDMLHYLLPEAQQQLLSRCVAQLLPGGVMIIRDADRNMDKAHRLTRFTEFGSTRLFMFNKTVNKLHFLSDNDIHEFAAQHGLNVECTNNDRYTSNKVYVLSANKRR